MALVLYYLLFATMPPAAGSINVYVSSPFSGSGKTWPMHSFLSDGVNIAVEPLAAASL